MPCLSRCERELILSVANENPYIQYLLSDPSQGRQIAHEVAKIVVAHAPLSDPKGNASQPSKSSNHSMGEEPSLTSVANSQDGYLLIIRELYAYLMNTMGREGLAGGVSSALRDALTTYRKQKKQTRNIHHDTVRALGLDWTPEIAAGWFQALPNIHLPKLKTPYPPAGKFICEDEAIKKLWYPRLMEAKQADKRLKRCEPLVIDQTKLVRTVEAGESIVVRDCKTNEIVLMVVRNFCGDIDVLEWMGRIVAEAVRICRNVRQKEDAGHISLVGFSAGQRSDPQFYWTRNLIRKISEGAAAAFRQDQSFVFALFWNLLLKRLPLEIMDEWKGWIAEEMLPAMNPQWKDHSDNRGLYEIEVLAEKVVFHDAELAPPTGIMSQNYARPGHYERQPHKYAASLTVVREGLEDQDGGHFFLSAYGIKIVATADTCLVWQPRFYHGTSLQRVDPYDPDPDFRQQGLAIVTSPRLPPVWAQFSAD
ncbi:hypothetical protein NP233_g11335 [Leucocoprinus birnbaumii]|uniref:Uncharacterized protein n=1 Tax=Leucocoprinus birnbaumii TaxID=56174 RepID=A0AAD5YLD5_9AGAR|nr:hypothetical protein NP233_g11335 [Leucocoprinus birnbaumii]